MILLATFILALCSIVYELLLAQMLSAFFGDTLTRYSVTVGLYMAAMGIGAIFLPTQYRKFPIIGLLKVELALSILGACSVLFMLTIYSALSATWFFFTIAHFLIIIIGLLTGCEIPLLVEIHNRIHPKSEALTLGIDYIGAFFGTVLFSLVLYPRLGLIPTSILLAAINALVGSMLVFIRSQVPSENRTEFWKLLAVQTLILLVLILVLFYSKAVEQAGISLYSAQM